MTVQKRRDPRTFKGAVTRILGVLGDEACATAVGKSASLIYKWSDPDRDSLPSVEQALALDLAYIAAGEGSAPIGTVYSSALECDHQVGQPAQASSHLNFSRDSRLGCVLSTPRGYASGNNGHREDLSLAKRGDRTS